MISNTILITGILCLAIGYFAGVVVISLTQNKTGNHAENEDRSDEKVGPGLVDSEMQKGLHLSEGANHQLTIRYDGNPLTEPADLAPDELAQLRRLVAGLESWLKVETPIRPLEKPSEGDTKPVEPQTTSTTAKKGTSRPEIAQAKKASASPQSIVGQIDEILQMQIAGTPLESKGIRLAETPGQGVCVWIGLQQYPGMDTVTDPEVNEAIRKAVKAWESKT